MQAEITAQRGGLLASTRNRFGTEPSCAFTPFSSGRPSRAASTWRGGDAGHRLVTPVCGAGDPSLWRTMHRGDFRDNQAIDHWIAAACAAADRFDAMATFVAVADAEGFAPAAAPAGPVAFGRHPAGGGVGDRLGLRLLQRTTRQVALTDAGGRFLLRARHLSDLREAEDNAEAERAAPPGIWWWPRR